MARKSNDGIAIGCAAIFVFISMLWAFGILEFLATCWIMPVLVWLYIKNPVLLSSKKCTMGLFMLFFLSYIFGAYFYPNMPKWMTISLIFNLSLTPLVAYINLKKSFINKNTAYFTNSFTAFSIFAYLLLIEGLLMALGCYNLFDFLRLIPRYKQLLNDNYALIESMLYEIHDDLWNKSVLSRNVLIISQIIGFCYVGYNYKAFRQFFRYKVFVIASTVIFVVYSILNIVGYIWYYQPTYIRECSACVEESECLKIASKTLIVKEQENAEAFAGITFKSNRRDTDKGIQTFINSITVGNTPYWVNKNIYVRSTSCIFGNNGLEAVSLDLQRVEEQSGNFYNIIDHKSDYYEYYSNYLYHDLDSTKLNSEEQSLWESVIKTISSKYGIPILGVSSDSLKQCDRNFYWNGHDKIIRYKINSENSSELTYIVNSHILNIIRDAQIGRMKQKEESRKIMQRKLKEEEKQRKKDSLENVQLLEKEQKENKQIKEVTSNSI